MEKKAQKKDKGTKSKAQGKAKAKAKAKAAKNMEGDEHKDLAEVEGCDKPVAKARASRKRKADKQIAQEQDAPPRLRSSGTRQRGCLPCCLCPCRSPC